MPTKSNPKPTETLDMTARLRAVYAQDGKFPRGSLNCISRRLFKLADKAGIKNARQTRFTDRHMLYARAVALGFGDSYEAKELHREVESSEEWVKTHARMTHADRNAATPQSPPPQKKQLELITVTIAEDNVSYIPYGLLPNDEIGLIECDDFRPGEIVFAFDKEERTWQVRLFIEYEEHPDWGRCVVLEKKDGSYVFNTAAYQYFRTVSIKRETVIERPTTKEGEAALTAQRIRRLRERLDKIDADDITDSTARFKVEKEIYDLEHPIDLEDWSAWEEKEEAAA